MKDGVLLQLMHGDFTERSQPGRGDFLTEHLCLVEKAATRNKSWAVSHAILTPGGTVDFKALAAASCCAF